MKKLLALLLSLTALFTLAACEKVPPAPAPVEQLPTESGTTPDVFLRAVTEGDAMSIRLERDGTKIASYTEIWDLPNTTQCFNGLQNLSWVLTDASTDTPSGDAVTLSVMNDWSLTAYADSTAIHFHGPTGEAWFLCQEAELDAPYSRLRNWYDEAEFSALGGTYDKQDAIVIPDVGQDYLAAAKDFTQAFESIHLQASSGSKFRYNFVATRVSEAEDITQVWRENGTIDEDTFCFYLYTTFVEENQRALNDAMAGNTRAYSGTDPNVPEGAWEYIRCGLISKKEDGWHGLLVGTGW